jgi:hypothetical protein
MTLDYLKGVLGELQKQYAALEVVQTPDTRGVLRHCNQIEVRAAIQLCEQLIQQEQIQLNAPPGATGPKV